MASPSQCPVRFDADVGMWVVADPDVVRSVLLRPDTFGPDNALTAYRALSPRSLRILNSVGFALPPTLANNSGPSHKKIRHTVAKFFGPGRVDTLRPFIAGLIRDRLPTLRSALARDDGADLVDLVAARVPAATLLQVIGMHDVNVERLKKWSRGSLELFWGTPDPERQEYLAGQAAEFYQWLRQQVIQERRTPGDGLFASLIALGLDDDQICAIGYFLLIAGQETTSQLISTVFFRTLKDPRDWRRCGNNRAYLAHLTDAALAENAPVPTWRRILSKPTRLAGADLPQGTELLLQLTGNDGGPDLAFGAGIHRCLGARLAKLETQVVVHEVASALPDLRLVDDDPPMIDLLSFRAPSELWATRTNHPRAVA